MKQKRMLNLLYGVVIALIISGCSMNQNIHYDNNKSINKKTISVPKLNNVNTVDVGQNMYEKAYLLFPNTYDVELLEPAVGKSGNLWVDTRKTHPTSAYPIYKKGINKLRKVGEQNVNAMCYTQWICLTDMENKGKFTHFSAFGTVNYKKLDKPTSYKIIPSAPIYSSDSFKYIALYQGKVDNKISISFREFRNNLARPAFTQNINYQLDNNGETIIGFKGLRIKVLKASNLEITYKVVKDYN
jgi:hypothetical protein